jgi:hypothetical protein
LAQIGRGSADRGGARSQAQVGYCIHRLDLRFWQLLRPLRKLIRSARWAAHRIPGGAG